ncbi:MAG: cupin domain-containing protein [Deltaproteobacteria bacterium]|nr:MAG: cupin domain-containing protein [Deltaproteobacteria bacterium]
MEIIDKNNIPPETFDSGEARGIMARVLIGKANGAGNFVMRLFEIAPGGYTPRHAHPWEHEIFVHSGEGSIYSNGEWTSVRPGMAIFVPPDEEHQLRNDGTEPFVVVCLIPSGYQEL